MQDYIQQRPPRMDAVAVAVCCSNDLIHRVLNPKLNTFEYILLMLMKAHCLG
jgi:hypothetical protein